MSKLIALVPMKGNSERVPNKNLKDFNGKPLFYWVIDSLYKSEVVDEVVINTDSDVISAEVKKYFPNIVIHQRPLDICGDFVSMNKVIENDLSYYSDNETFVQTHSTNPLLSSETIAKAFEEFKNKESDFDSLFSVLAHYGRFYNTKSEPVNHNPKELIRTQDLDPLLEENSCLYFFNHSSFEKEGKRIGVAPKLFKMDKIESLDIDTPEDFSIAESLHKRLRG